MRQGNLQSRHHMRLSSLPEAHNNLGLMLSRTPGRLPDAIAKYQAAQRIRLDYVGLVGERVKELRASRSVSQKYP